MLEVLPVTIDNWREISRLKVREDQARFVAPNLRSIAETQFGFKDKPGLGHWTASSFGLYDEGQPVGYFMIARNEQNPKMQGYIVRLMVDENYQGRGFGRFAMNWILETFRADKTIRTVAIDYEPDNEAARRLYASLGFRETGEIEDGEVVAILELKKQG
ncbi:MAG TPA: GNAT family N-acetyltransferase [Anaerolineales bacterium]|nr:GNAT family N-acetyltransferase [Anaerolineales bacterium]HNN13285.1 GNAT family N-acetyltransferase [Anaerolineales bacterium]HNO31768.1 GNAT family N-acetyltransferase [Anaerolineales bacterium]